MDEVIRTENLKKYFGKVKAVDGISIHIGRGEIYGFLGLNGAGKTTTIRLLLGMMRPTSGSAYLNGIRVNAGQTQLWNRVGYLVEIPYSYPDLTVVENLEMFRRLRLIPDKEVVERVMDHLKLIPYKDRLAKNLSLGNSQRLGLAKAIMHHPEILILDEPANGLDPAGLVEIRELLHNLALNQGVTILVSSHLLGEVSKFATRIGIIHDGKMIQETETDELIRYVKRRLLVKVRDRKGASDLLKNNGYVTGDKDSEVLEVAGNNALDHPEQINQLLVNAGYLLSMIRVEEEDLESYFLRVIGKSGGEA